ncbi:hypothetical protein [Chroococcidiopsis sp. SAG 2025]|uniref:hypothetical protein n=1 Tax=Chroococcidiopsis sp. SAG 2025 TaxID=171389 RepID=UPI0029371B93|nr:hypothetical protein [Chroococcidiopsis sp. SAG 2025]
MGAEGAEGAEEAEGAKQFKIHAFTHSKFLHPTSHTPHPFIAHHAPFHRAPRTTLFPSLLAPHS